MITDVYAHTQAAWNAWWSTYPALDEGAEPLPGEAPAEAGTGAARDRRPARASLLMATVTATSLASLWALSELSGWGSGAALVDPASQKSGSRRMAFGGQRAGRPFTANPREAFYQPRRSPAELALDPIAAERAQFQQTMRAIKMGDGVKAVSGVDFRMVKEPQLPITPCDRLVFFSMYIGNGSMPEHTRYLARHLGLNRDAVHGVIATDVPVHTLQIEPQVVDLFASLMVRENLGLDFACYAHLLQRYPSFFNASSITLTNDSNLGPLRPEWLMQMFQRADRTNSSVVGATEAAEVVFDKPHWHLQSSFLVLKRRALQNWGMQHFWLDSIYSKPDKFDVIVNYEMMLAKEAIAMGLKTEALFSLMDSEPAANPTTVWAQNLIDMQYAFLKRQIFQADSTQHFWLRESLNRVDLAALQLHYPFDLAGAKAAHDSHPAPLPEYSAATY